MVEILGAPISISCSYDPSYKVDLCLHEQLWSRTMTSSDLAVEIMALLSQLDALCQSESEEVQTPRSVPRGGRKRLYSNTFDTQASLFRDRLERLLQKHPISRLGLQGYLQQTGLGTLYPRAAHYISDAQGQTQIPKKAPMDGYMSHLAAVNQVNTLCIQLRYDIQNLGNHKYVAHQVALLYQSLNQLGNVKALLSYRNNIEGMFKKLKSALELTSEGDSVPHLPEDYRKWLVDLTKSLQEVMSSFNPSFNQPLLPAIGFLQQEN